MCYKTEVVERRKCFCHFTKEKTFTFDPSLPNNFGAQNPKWNPLRVSSRHSLKGRLPTTSRVTNLYTSFMDNIEKGEFKQLIMFIFSLKIRDWREVSFYIL